MTLQEEINKLEAEHANLEKSLEEAVSAKKPDPIVTVLKKNKLRVKDKIDALKAQLASMG